MAKEFVFSPFEHNFDLTFQSQSRQRVQVSRLKIIGFGFFGVFFNLDIIEIGRKKKKGSIHDLFSDKGYVRKQFLLGVINYNNPRKAKKLRLHLL